MECILEAALLLVKIRESDEKDDIRDIKQRMAKLESENAEHKSHLTRFESQRRDIDWSLTEAEDREVKNDNAMHKHNS